MSDLRQVSDPSTEVHRWQERLAHSPFELETGPLVRARLLQIQDNRFDFILILHHLIADGWSRGVLLKELATYYRGYVAGHPISLPALNIQYADYVLRQQQLSQTSNYQAQLAYWQQQLADLSPLSLPNDSADLSVRNAIIDFSSRTLTHTFSSEQTQAIKTLGQQSGATLFMVLLAVFKLLLHRYSGQRDLAVGVPYDGRNTADVEPLIGFFVNTLVLRTELTAGHSTFQDWLKVVQATVADALQHQDVSFPEVVDALNVERIPGQNPLFQVMFQVQNGYQLQNAEQLALDMPGLSPIQGWIELNQTKFDMSWHVIERDGSLLVAVEYRTALFECDRIQRMFNHFQTLTASVLANSDKPLSELNFLSEQEHHQLGEWSQGKGVAPSQSCFPQRFEQQVEKTPDAIAVRIQSNQSETRILTYQQLNQRANQLAHWLKAQGIGPEKLVGVCLSPGIDLVVALLATLKACGAYVPLDPALPQARLHYMVQDSHPQVLIAQDDALGAAITENSSTPVIVLDEAKAQLAAQPSQNPPGTIGPDNLAYAIYTSGSTGKPKGTLLSHRGLTNYLNWCIASYPLTQGQGVLVQSSIGFDATITSLFSPLLVGQSLHFNPDVSEIEAIQQALSAGMSLIKLTPAHLRALQPLLNAHPLAKERLPKALVIGGESLHQHHIDLWQKHYPDIALINEYGPTETVVGCCVHWVSQQDHGSLPIGRPIDGAQLYVLDEYLERVPVGIPGELYIGGAGIARGYLNRPGLTAERFVPNPFAMLQTADRPGNSNTLYKTGDLVRYRADGTLDYLGRIDNQLKVRGFRIEPGEIEALLCQHPQVNQSIVILSEEQGRTDLVAYVVGSAGIASTDFPQLSADLKQHLTQTLPPYMVPTQFVELAQLPLTNNGKIDRQALPKPQKVSNLQTIVLPQTDKETILLDIWQQILGHNSVGIYDYFFELGGDSISAMQIVSKAQQQGLSLTPTQLFEHQTIAAQAAVAQQAPTTASITAPVVGDAPLGPIQWDLFNQALVDPHHYNQSIMVVVKPEVNADYLKTGLQLLADHHDALRLRFRQTAQSSWEQHYAPAGTVPFDVLALTDEQHLADAVTTLQASLDLTKGPLFRGVLLHLNEGGSRLLLIAHHLVVDGVSWRILLTDLLTLYAQLEAQQTPTLPQKTTAFGDWTRHIQAQQFETEFSYWSDVCEATPGLPVDNLSETNTVDRQGEISTTLDAEQTGLLKSVKLPADVLLTTALAQTLNQWSRNSTLILDMEGHGRHSWSDSIDLSQTVGWFTALFPVKLSLPAGSLADQLSYVQKTLNQFPNHGIGYGALRANLPQGDCFSSPAEISFNYLGKFNLNRSQGFMQGLAPEKVVAMRHPKTQCRYLMEIIALIQPGATGNDQLQIVWRYGQQCYHSSTLEQLSQRYINNLKSLIAHCSRPKDYTSSSFSAARVDSQQLSQLMNKLATKGRA